MIEIRPAAELLLPCRVTVLRGPLLTLRQRMTACIIERSAQLLCSLQGGRNERKGGRLIQSKLCAERLGWGTKTPFFRSRAIFNFGLSFQGRVAPYQRVSNHTAEIPPKPQTPTTPTYLIQTCFSVLRFALPIQEKSLEPSAAPRAPRQKNPLTACQLVVM